MTNSPARLTQFRQPLAKHPLAHQQRGLTMIEMIIASALSITLLTGVYQIYSGNKRTYTVQDELARMQENARFAMEFISKDIRKAGHTGCSRGVVGNQNNVATTNSTFNPLIGLQGWEAANTQPQASTVSIDPVGDAGAETFGSATGTLVGTAPGTLTIEGITTAIPNSDMIRVWFAKPESQPVTTIVGNTINLAAALDLNQGDVVVVSDCDRIDFVQQCGANNSAIIATQAGCTTAMAGNFLTVSAETATARPLDMALYFVGKPGASTTPTGLYKQALSGTTAGNSTLVSEGVENMQILYGVDSDNNNIPDRYFTADNVGDWNRVINVKISLLLSSANNVVSKDYQGQFELNGVTLLPAQDRRIRRVFSTTIALRNRV